MAQQDGSPAKASGEHRAVRLQAELRRVWDYGTWYCTASCYGDYRAAVHFGTIQQNSTA
ncbi:MAG: hypothetical protein ACLSVD_07595 [Eggerthellaceae bacterium]